jgi:hypothetical protein
MAKRDRTDSPLQAIILLNGTQYVETARMLGEKLHKESAGDVSKMIEQGFLICLSREPDKREIEICTQLYREQLEHFEASPKDAEAFLRVGNANHDACVVKR